MYTKCFSTLIYCGWAYGCTLTLLHMTWCWCRFGEFSVRPGLNDVAVSWLRLQNGNGKGKNKDKNKDNDNGNGNGNGNGN